MQATKNEDERKKARRVELKSAPRSDTAQPVSDANWRIRKEVRQRIIVAAFLLAAGVWAYWPMLVELVEIWTTEPEYSHGFLVVPLSLFFLWARRDQIPASSSNGFGLGCFLLVTSVALRCVGARFFMSFLDAWSILLWIAATVALLGGRPLLVWSLPSIAFLWFMVPLPATLETLLSGPLQTIATQMSTWTLECLGQPALAEGTKEIFVEENTILPKRRLVTDDV